MPFTCLWMVHLYDSGIDSSIDVNNGSHEKNNNSIDFLLQNKADPYPWWGSGMEVKWACAK